MRLAHDVSAVRAAERRAMARLGDGVLMQRAAAGLAAASATAIGRVYGARVVVLAGVGDNGGDALFAGALLARRGARVDVVLVDPDRVHAGGLAAARQAGARVATDTRVIARADVVLDGLVGIGGTGGLRPAAAVLAQHITGADAGGTTLVVAVDLPSGVDADTGEVAGPAVRADLTVTFGTYKPGLLVDPGAGHAGAVVLVDIGLEPGDFRALGDEGEPSARAWQAADLRSRLPRATAESASVVSAGKPSSEFSWIDIIDLNARERASTSVRDLPFTAIDIIDAADWLMEQPWPSIRMSEMAPPSSSR